MFRIKKWHWALAACAAAWTADNGFCIERDPYIYKSLVGKIYLEYEKSVLEQPQQNLRQETNRFKQIYSLDVKGNYLSRRFIIYDAGIAWTDDTNKTGSTTIDTKTLEYFGRTTILPKSAIPLTLYANRNETTVNTAGGDTTKTVYGLNWFARLRSLPQTAVYAERSEDKGSNSNLLNTNYRVNMSKDIGPTENSVEYAGSKLENQIRNETSNTNTFNLRNITKVSRSTQLNVGATKSNTKNKGTNTPDTSIEGLSLNLTSRPSQDFSQNHQYIYYSNKTDGKQTGNNYNGNLNLRISSRLNSHYTLSVDDTKSVTRSNSTKSKSVNSTAGFDYTINRNFSLNQSFAYSSYRSTTAAAANDVNKRYYFREMTALNYRKPLSWANLQASYGLGFTQEKANFKLASALPTAKEGGGKGIEQNASIALGDINFNPLIGFNASARYANVKSLSGNVSGYSKTYHLDAFNKPGRKYVVAIASYEKNAQSSWLSVLESRNETYRFTATSDYLRNTRFRYEFNHTNSFNEKTDFSRSTNQTFSADHTRPFLGGNLVAAFVYSFAENNFAGGTQRIDTRSYTLSYGRRIGRTLAWQANLLRTETKQGPTFTRYTQLKNIVFMPIRSWLLAAEHTYTLTEDNLRDQKETVINLKLTRTFVRFFF